MTFTEANLVRDPIRNAIAENGMLFVPGMSLSRTTSDVMLEDQVRDALVRLNPDIAAMPERADEVIHALRGITLNARSGSLLAANQEFTAWLRADRSRPFGESGEHTTVRLLDLDNPTSPDNRWTVSTEVTFIRGRVHRRFDLVIWCNGFPLIVGEAKTPTRPGYSWEDGAYQVHENYEKNVPMFFTPNVLSFASEGKDFRYGSVGMPEDKWGPWRDDKTPSGVFGLERVMHAASAVLTPDVIIDFLRYFTAFGTDRKHRKIKVIARFQQYQGANAIVERVVEGRIRSGLIWHFQGSGKSLLMVFAAQKLRATEALQSPTVLIVVDRINLDSQITGDFLSSGVQNVVTTDSRSELMALLKSGTRKVIITTIHKFAEADGVMDDRSNIVVMVDEAHRTQEGDLGRKMRTALPNAFRFGLTGTPINSSDRNTFVAFGTEEDKGGYLSLYSWADSVRDGATLPLRFEPRPVELKINEQGLNLAFDTLANEHDLTDEQRAVLTKREATIGHLIKAPRRVDKVAADAVAHFFTHVEPHGFKAQLVAYDKEACVAYKEAIDRLLPEEASAVIMSIAASDPKEWKDRFSLDRHEEEALLDRFNDPADPLQILIVTAKLLTGFDAPILQVQYLDRPLRNHTLLQAVCRTNRTAPGKEHGIVVDYLGAFDDVAKSLQFDDPNIKDIVTSMGSLKTMLPGAFEAALSHFDGVDRSVGGYEGIVTAQAMIPDEETRDAFAADYGLVSRLWEALSPDPVLSDYESDFVWLTAVYHSIQPAETSARRLWKDLGAKTLEIINKHVSVEIPRTDLDTISLTEEVIDDFTSRKGDPAERASILEALITKHIDRRRNNPEFIALGQRLVAIREKYAHEQQASLAFLREMLELARDTVVAEKKAAEMPSEAHGQAALTRLFESVKTAETPIEVERVVQGIDKVVRQVRWDNWQNTMEGDRDVRQALRQELWIKHKIRDQTVYEKAYDYVREYY